MSCKCGSHGLTVCYAPLHCKVEVSCNGRIWSWKNWLQRFYLFIQRLCDSRILSPFICYKPPPPPPLWNMNFGVIHQEKDRQRALIPWLQLSCAIYIYWASGCRETKSPFNILQRLWVYKWAWAVRAEKRGRDAKGFLCCFAWNSDLWPHGDVGLGLGFFTTLGATAVTGL